MKLALVFTVAKLVALLALAVGAGSCYPHTCLPNDTSCLPCPDPRTTNPACAAPWQPIPVETKQKKTCYRVTMGCSDIEWGPVDEHGNSKGKCVAKMDDTPHEIPCDDVPKPDAGARD